tara:strand:- start:226 stop:483 length:258 start_codon:yes stop_codon:yes gene_type:complete
MKNETKLVELMKFTKTLSRDMRKEFKKLDKQETLDTSEEIEYYHSLEDSLSLFEDIKSYLKEIDHTLYDKVDYGDTERYIQSEYK